MAVYNYRLGSLSVSLSNPQRKAGDNHTFVSYSVRDLDWGGSNPVFAGDDLGVSPMHNWDSPDAALALLAFLTVQEGDVDSDYFTKYTPDQIRWRDERAEQFAWQVSDREERRAKRSA